MPPQREARAADERTMARGAALYADHCAVCHGDDGERAAPAYPALGRTVRNGVLYVDGVAVAQSAFAHDALNPIRGSSVSAMLGPDLPCTIFDGETDSDLREAARVILADRSPATGACIPL